MNWFFCLYYQNVYFKIPINLREYILTLTIVFCLHWWTVELSVCICKPSSYYYILNDLFCFIGVKHCPFTVFWLLFSNSSFVSWMCMCTRMCVCVCVHLCVCVWEGFLISVFHSFYYMPPHLLSWASGHFKVLKSIFLHFLS